MDLESSMSNGVIAAFITIRLIISLCENMKKDGHVTPNTFLCSQFEMTALRSPF